MLCPFLPGGCFWLQATILLQIREEFWAGKFEGGISLMAAIPELEERKPPIYGMDKKKT